jgi:Tfp pilus assembly pilus retraction ATPase PilT
MPEDDARALGALPLRKVGERIEVAIADPLDRELQSKLIALLHAPVRLLVAPLADNLIREGCTHQLRNVIRSGREEGMFTLETALNDLVAAGRVSYDDAVAQSMRPKEILRRESV